MAAHSLNPKAWKAEAGRPLNLKPLSWSELIIGYKETMCENKTTQPGVIGVGSLVREETHSEG